MICLEVLVESSSIGLSNVAVYGSNNVVKHFGGAVHGVVDFFVVHLENGANHVIVHQCGAILSEIQQFYTIIEVVN